MGVPRGELPDWDDLQILTAQLHRPPLLDDRRGRHRRGDRTERAKAAAPQDPAVRLGHELRRAVGAGQGRAGARRGACRHRHLFRRRRHAARGAGGQLALFLRTGLRPFRLRLGQARAGPGVPFQGRAGRQDRHRRASAGPQGQGQDRRGARHPRRRRRDLAGALSRLDRARTDQGLRRRGARPDRRHSDRLQALGAAHREGHRRRAGGRASTTSSSTGAAAAPAPRRSSSATTSRCRRSRRWPGRGGTWTGWTAATSRW